jgi:hypothetical protein
MAQRRQGDERSRSDKPKQQHQGVRQREKVRVRPADYSLAVRISQRRRNSQSNIHTPYHIAFSPHK